MKLKDFQYELPERLIAQHPTEQRTGSRLMVLDRQRGTIEHKGFPDLIGYLSYGDCMVLNNTKVIPARLLGNKADTGAHVEFLLLERKGQNIWEAMTSPGRKTRPGARVVFGDGVLEGSVVEVLENGNRVVEFSFDGDFERILNTLGKVPLPPYIKSGDVDKDRYQTVYSTYNGSVAAPTAGLHFSAEYLQSIRGMGVTTAFVTLHVGAGTFLPVKSENIEDHKMHAESYFIDEATAEAVNRTKGGGAEAEAGAGTGSVAVNRTKGGTGAEYGGSVETVCWAGSAGSAGSAGRVDSAGGAESADRAESTGRVIAVGTTSLRTLETVASDCGLIKPCEGRTDIFIYPGYRFKCADALLTNFHLPGSTLIMLVSAFAGYDFTMEAYREAVSREYRFFSFGDAMLII